MMRNKKTFIGIVLLIAVLLIGIGYAAVTRTLTIEGSAKVSPDDNNFIVQFTGTPTTGGNGTTTAGINEGDATKATIEVEGLTTKGQKATATYTIENVSKAADLTAYLSLDTKNTTNSNEDYFKVTHEFAEESVAVNGTTTVTISVEVMQTPITADETADITIVLSASPEAPATEGNS